MKKLTITLIAILSFGCFALAQSASTFINEVNYLASNPTQGLEIVGQAGQDMEGWSIVIYAVNGTVDYIEYLNNGIIPNQQNGYGSIWYDVEQGSNGGGVALVEPNGDVVQFLSYGTLGFLNTILQAVEGPAQGMTAEYIGIQLLPSNSLQLTGLGLDYLDFIWATPIGNTPGTINTNQAFGLPAALGTPSIAGIPSLAQNDFEVMEIEVYPNPTTDFIRVSVPQTNEHKQSSIALFDANGRLLKTMKLNENTSNRMEFDLSQYDLGTYFLKYTNGAIQVTKSIVVN